MILYTWRVYGERAREGGRDGDEARYSLLLHISIIHTNTITGRPPGLVVIAWGPWWVASFLTPSLAPPPSLALPARIMQWKGWRLLLCWMTRRASRRLGGWRLCGGSRG